MLLILLSSFLSRACCDPWQWSACFRSSKITLAKVSFFGWCKNNCFKACNSERWWREDKNRKKDNSELSHHMLHEICTKPCATMAPTIHPPNEGLGAQNWNHPVLPISSENSGGEFNPGLPFILMEKQEHKSGKTPSTSEYPQLKKIPMFLY